MKTFFLGLLLVITYSTSCKASVMVINRDGSYFSETSLAAAISSSGTNDTIIVVSTANTVDSDVTVPATIALKIGEGGSISVRRGKTLTVNGTFTSAITRIFLGDGVVIFGKGAVDKIYAEWWQNNSVPGTTDMAAAISAALESMQGIYEPTALVNNSPGGFLQLLNYTYAISAEIVVTKGGTVIRGQGAQNTKIKYIGAGSVADVIRFKDTNYSELSALTLDGNAASATQGAKACLGIDLAAFFTSHDLYMMNSTLYGIRASQLWESYFENTQIRGTGRYSTVNTPGAAIAFTSVDQSSTVFPISAHANNVSNNTTFIKPSLVPAGGLVRTDQPTVNISFLTPITETSPMAGNIQAIQEDQWSIGNNSENFQIIGGYWSGNAQLVKCNGSVFNFNGNNPGVSVSGYNIINPYSGNGYPAAESVFKINTYFPISVKNVTIFENVTTSFSSIFSAPTSGTIYSASLLGNITYVTGGTIRTVSSMFAVGATGRFSGKLTIQNGSDVATYDSGRFSNATTITHTDGPDSGHPYTAMPVDSIILADATTGDVYITLDSCYYRSVSVIKKDNSVHNVIIITSGYFDYYGAQQTKKLDNTTRSIKLYRNDNSVTYVQ